MMEAWIRQIWSAKTGILVAIVSMIPASAIAQSSLPPPPPSLPGQSAPPPNVVPGAVPSAPLPTIRVQPVPGRSGQPQSVPTERVFEAPRVSPVRSNAGQFRVVVENDSADVLQQVRLVQPDAFIQNMDGRRVIQAGLFSNEMNARQQIALLANQGISSRITTQAGSSIGNGNQNGDQGGSYYVIVPGRSDELQLYYSRAIQLGLAQSSIQMRDRPRGPHLSIGPFANRREAEQVSNDLRDRANVDARVFYDR